MRGQGLPVNMIVLVALALIVLVVVAAFFITGMSGAAQQTVTVEEFQAYCNNLCGQMVVAANNANTIMELRRLNIAVSYQNSGCADKFGCCTVTLRSGNSVCAAGQCDSGSDCGIICLDPSDYPAGSYLPDIGTMSSTISSAPNVWLPATQICESNICVIDHFNLYNAATCTAYCSNCLKKSPCTAGTSGGSVCACC